MNLRSLACLAACFLLSATLVRADDWPQFRGPDRSGRSPEKGLLQTWPKDGPKLLWTYRQAGLGYSSSAIVGDRLYTMGARGDTTYVLCLDVKSGKEVWHAKVGRKFTFPNNQWGDGPRSTPTVDGKLVYALGGFGDLVCLETAGGKEVWRTNLAKDLGGQMMTSWGFSESPLVDGKRLVCTPGGPGGTLAALDKTTGKVVWRSKDLKDRATYASLQVHDLGGIRQYVAETFAAQSSELPKPASSETGVAAVAGVAAADGKRLWYHPFLDGSSYEVTPTPLLEGNLVYVTAEASGNFRGCKLLQVTPRGKGQFGVKELYKGPAQRVMNNWHGGVVLVDQYVYGYSYRKGWTCQELKTGRVAWLDRASLEGGSGSLIYAGGRLYLLSDQGEAVLLKPSSRRWEEAGRFKLPEASKQRAESGGVWTHPALANGRLYLRDQELLFCYDVGKK